MFKNERKGENNQITQYNVRKLFSAGGLVDGWVGGGSHTAVPPVIIFSSTEDGRLKLLFATTLSADRATSLALASFQSSLPANLREAYSSSQCVLNIAKHAWKLWLAQ